MYMKGNSVISLFTCNRFMSNYAFIFVAFLEYVTEKTFNVDPALLGNVFIHSAWPFVINLLRL
jgi:hypothetical protein